MLLLNNVTRATILNASDAVNEHNEAIGYALRAAVSGRTVDHKIECERDSVAALLKKGAQGASNHTGELIGRALGALEAADVATMSTVERAQRAARLHADPWAMIR